MGEKKLLDCTLRDGGYVNDWEFGHNNIISIFERLVDANIDIIEIGFLDDRRMFDLNRSIMPDTESVTKIYGGLNRKQSLIVGMIDYGTCDIKHIQPCSESFLDGIRVIFKKHLRVEALGFCAQLMKLGYTVFAQLVSVTSYSDAELMDIIRLANEIEPYAVSMVDTYGLMHQNNLMHYFKLLNEYLKTNIGIGYHGHNNFQMGYANCVAMLSQDIDRMMLVDGSMYGMGKSAGNAPIELIAMHMNQNCGKDYHISQLLEAIDSNIMNFYKPASWGYNLFYYIAAFNDCHPNYVSYLMNKRTLSIKSINEILHKLEGEDKLLYSQKTIDQLYLEYQTNIVDDTKALDCLQTKLMNQKVLLLGPGYNIYKQRNRIEAFLNAGKTTIISVNMVSEEFVPDYIFLSNAKRYVQLATELSQKNRKCAVIAASNVTATSGEFDYVVNYSSLLDQKAEIIDNSFIMLLKLIIKLGIPKVYLAGFDGYFGQHKKNYLYSDMEYKFTKEQANNLNRYVASILQAMHSELDFEFITDSLYIEEDQSK